MNIEIELSAIDGTSIEKIEIDSSIYNELVKWAKHYKCDVEDIMQHILTKEFEHIHELPDEK